MAAALAAGILEIKQLTAVLTGEKLHRTSRSLRSAPSTDAARQRSSIRRSVRFAIAATAAAKQAPAPLADHDRPRRRPTQQGDIERQQCHPERQHPKAEDRQEAEQTAQDEEHPERDPQPAGGGMAQMAEPLAERCAAGAFQRDPGAGPRRAAPWRGGCSASQELPSSPLDLAAMSGTPTVGTAHRSVPRHLRHRHHHGQVRRPDDGASPFWRESGDQNARSETARATSQVFVPGLRAALARSGSD